MYITPYDRWTYTLFGIAALVPRVARPQSFRRYTLFFKCYNVSKLLKNKTYEPPRHQKIAI